MRNANLSDADLSAYSGEHLLYELQYLWFSAKDFTEHCYTPETAQH